MQEKIYVLTAYALTGLFIALWPLWMTEKGMMISSPFFRSMKSSTVLLWQSLCLAVASIGVILITGESVASPLILSFGLISIVSSLSGRRFDVVATFSSFLAFCVSATIPWWQRQNGSLDISSINLLVFGLVTFVFIYSFTTQVPNRESRFPITWIIIYSLLATILSFSTGIFTDSNAFLTLWHHWGAYVGPAELLLSGATIFHDFPVQYGLGPTALIASSCANDCWRGMYFITGFTTLAFSVLIAVLALALSRNRWTERLAILALCLVTLFFWIAYPPSLSSPVTTPSVSGLRFLPAMLLITYLFFAKHIEYSKLGMLIAHGLWVFGALWSPESAFYVTFVWWPYYLFIQRVQGGFLSRVKGFANSAMRLLVIGVGLVIVFNIVFRIIYNQAPSLYGFLAYALNPPGPMPINPHGAVWFFLFVTIIGVGTLLHLWHRTGDTLSFRRGFLVQLLSYGAFSYFLGRSHDNNLLNILPFMLLVLLHAISTSSGKIFHRVSVVLSATLLSWLPLFGWQAWSESLMEGRVLTFDSKLMLNSMSFSNPDTTSKIADRFARYKMVSGSPQDAGRAIEFIRKSYGEPVTVLDSSMNLVRSKPTAAWSAIHGPANFPYIPSQRRREFLSATATSLNRSGWLIVDKKFPSDEWLADFDFAYERTNRLEFGTYYAIRFSPKRHSEVQFDFLALFENGHVNDDRHVDTPSGKGAFILPLNTQLGVDNTLTVLSGFSYTYDNVFIGQSPVLRFDVGMVYPIPEPARAVVKVIGGDGIVEIVYSMVLPIQPKMEKVKLLPIPISLNRYSGQKVSVVFSVETPGNDSSGHWVAFGRPRIVELNKPW
jgi:hypothetical protein